MRTGKSLHERGYHASRPPYLTSACLRPSHRHPPPLHRLPTSLINVTMGGTADELTKGCKVCMALYVIFSVVVVVAILWIGVRAQRKLRALADLDNEEKQRRLEEGAVQRSRRRVRLERKESRRKEMLKVREAGLRP